MDPDSRHELYTHTPTLISNTTHIGLEPEVYLKIKAMTPRAFHGVGLG